MKLRNQLLALACLLLFIAFGFLYFYKWVEQKPFGIIIFVCDELTPANITVARMYDGGADHRLNLESLPNMALLTNYSNDFAIPDDAASASALATGEKVNNRSIAMDPSGKALVSILEAAHDKGRYTGLVTTGNLTDAGAAAFYAHARNADDVSGLASQLIENTKLNVVLGGGARAFTPESNGGLRKDGRDLTLELKDKRLVRSKAELENTSSFLSTNLVGLFSNEALAYSNAIESGNQQPSLSDMVRRSIEFLQYNASGYVLVVDSGLGSRAARQNDGEHVISETLALDRALKVARDYAGEKTLIIVVGRHSTGGMVLNGYPLRQDHGVGLLGINSFGYPAIAWATGPNGPVPAPILEPAQPAPEPVEKKNQGAKTEPAAFYIRDGGVSNAADVVAVGVGPGSQVLKGFLDNTVIFKIVKDNL